MKELYLACIQAESVPEQEAPPGGEWEWDYSQQDQDPNYWGREGDEDEIEDEYV
jgi:hypothetical protein